MFTILSPDVVRSSDGYEVRDLGVVCLTYIQDDGHIARIQRESIGDGKFLYYLSEIKWGSPYEGEPISAEAASAIRQRILEALTFLGGKFETDLDQPKTTVTFKTIAPSTVTTSDGKTITVRADAIVYCDGSNTLTIPYKKGHSKGGSNAIVIAPVKISHSAHHSAEFNEYSVLRVLGQALAILGYKPLVVKK